MTLGGDALAALLDRSADIHTTIGLLAEAGLLDETVTLSSLDELNEVAERVLGLA